MASLTLAGRLSHALAIPKVVHPKDEEEDVHDINTESWVFELLRECAVR